MASDPHAQSVDLALRTVDDLGGLIDRIGHADAAGGRIYAAYRQARRALAGRLDNRAATADILKELRASIAASAAGLLSGAVELGAQQAANNLALYSIRTRPPVMGQMVKDLLNGWLATVDAQIAATLASTALPGADDATILGDTSRAGVLTPGPVARVGARAVVSLAMGAFHTTVNQSARDAGFLKQWVAAIDERTTDCCLQAHGQTQPLDTPFHLVGTPRYADYVMDPPGHWYCRAAEALVPPYLADDDLSRQMKNAALQELGARDVLGNRQTIHPANAYSRR